MTENITQVTWLYRGTVNNGVHTILTEAAVAALQQLTEGTHDSTEDLLSIVAGGTFTFVQAGERYNRYYRSAVTGTLDELDLWVGGRLLPSPFDNYVPFSNGSRTQDPEYVRSAGEVIAAFGPIAALSHNA